MTTTEGATIWKFYINTNIKNNNNNDLATIHYLYSYSFGFCLIAAAVYAVIVISAKHNKIQQIKGKLVSVSEW